jgi:hypothetical protein
VSRFRAVARCDATLTAALICVAGLFAAFSAAPKIFPQFISVSASAKASASFDHNEKGLQSQYQVFVDAFSSQGATQSHQAFVLFALPNPRDWFGKYFAREQVPQLEKDYEAELSTYEGVLAKRLSGVPAGTRFRVHCKVSHPDSTIHMQPRRDAIAPLSSIPVEQFVCEFDPAPKLKYGRFSMFVNYVYVDGAFRYVGTGAYPFWSTPDARAR